MQLPLRSGVAQGSRLEGFGGVFTVSHHEEQGLLFSKSGLRWSLSGGAFSQPLLMVLFNVELCRVQATCACADGVCKGEPFPLLGF